MTAPAKEARLPYRRCVGVVLMNREGRVFVGRRARGEQDPLQLDHPWQMPQGGIDRREDPLAAARRELREETGVRSAELIATAPDWYAYDFPPEVLARTRSGKFAGQTQLWFAFRFTGDDSEIDLSAPGHKPEFTEWRWARLAELPDLIVPFKRPVYEKVVAAFAHLAS
jgi:putative (di)nucleoside polyphosphate hydrolase